MGKIRSLKLKGVNQKRAEQILRVSGGQESRQDMSVLSDSLEAAALNRMDIPLSKAQVWTSSVGWIVEEHQS